MNGNLIYVVEDDAALRSELAQLLSLQNYQVQCCEDFPAAAAEVAACDPALVILDLRLPGTDGLQICRDIRQHSAVPCLVLTSSDAEFDEVMALRLGADDYLTKPYSPAVLLAHVERILARSKGGPTNLPQWRGLTLDGSRSCAAYGGRLAELSRNEMRILGALLRAQGGIVSRYDLMYELWQSDEFIDDNTLTVNVNRLRKSLAVLGVPDDFLKTHRGQGYSL